MNEQLLLTIINFYESHIEQLKLAHAEKEKVNQMAYAELEKMNDDLEEKNEEWKAIAGARLNLSEGHRIEKEKLKKENKKLKKISVAIDQNVKLITKIEEIDQLKKENRKVKKISVARGEMLQKIKNQNEELEAKKLRAKEKRKK